MQIILGFFLREIKRNKDALHLYPRVFGSNSIVFVLFCRQSIKISLSLHQIRRWLFSSSIIILDMDNYSISSFPNQEVEKSSRIELKGELSIQHIHEIKKELEAAIKDMDTIELLVYEASIIDLTILQYLLSLKRSEKALNKSFKISFELDDDLNELLKHAGFKNIENIRD